jgi:hypothetical protein
MIRISSRRHGRILIRKSEQTHRFAVGQAVRMKNALPTVTNGSRDIYHITATLPPADDLPQYRVRNDRESHDRVATQDKLEPVNIIETGDRATLIERTFGHG